MRARLVDMIEVIHKTRTTRPRAAGTSAVSTDYTQIVRDGEVVASITWNPALLHRLDIRGETRDDYISTIIEKVEAH